MSRQNKRKLRFAIIDDESHKQLWVRSLTQSRLVIVITTIVIVTLGAIFSAIAFTPIRSFIPGYPDARTRHENLSNAILIDSLKNAVDRWAFYSDNLLKIIEGKDAVSLDSLTAMVADTSIKRSNISVLMGKDSLLRNRIAEEEQFEFSGKNRNLTIEGMQFFTPIKGVISRQYDPVMHPYLDINGPEGSVVMAALSGRVVCDYWSDEYAYVLIIQHDNNIITEYKGNRKNLRKTGDKVNAGDPVAIMGDHLHFEIWNKGEAVNPAKYINF